MDILEKKTARFMVVGDITTTVNKGRQAGRANEWSTISLDVHGSHQRGYGKVV